MLKVNTALLVVVIALLVVLLLRPQAGRFQHINALHPYLLDSATGELVLPDQIRAEQETRQASAALVKEFEAFRQRRKWLADNCTEILSGGSSRPNAVIPVNLQLKACQEWQQAQHTTTE
ncbi:MAG: hypothetical protein IH793_11415 [Acidobacteria bacterium]|nr:hypothetical protein [Acidobacteriota bacterium]